MKQNTTAKMLALFLTLCMMLSVGGVAAFADEPISGTAKVDTNTGHLELNPSNQEINTNTSTGQVDLNQGSINLNQGTVGINHGTVGENAIGGTVSSNGEMETLYNSNGLQQNARISSGTIQTNNGTVLSNVGNININSGTVSRNESIYFGGSGYISENKGTVTDNDGNIHSNTGTVTNNNQGAKIENNANTGSVLYNYGKILNNTGMVYGNDGSIDSNSGTVDFNRNSIYVNDTAGTVNTNRGQIDNNHGTVKTNDNYYGNEAIDTNYGTVEVNRGTVSKNENKVGENSGTVKENNGTVTTNTKDGTITENNGTVSTNMSTVGAVDEEGNVSGNNGTVTSNTANGVVLNLENGTVETNYGEVYNYGGTVGSSQNSGREFFSVEIVNATQNTISSSNGLKSAYGLQWLGEVGGTQTTATVTLIPEEGYEIKEIPCLPDNVTSRKNTDGTWTLTVTSGKKTTIDIPEATVIPYTVTVHNGSGSRDYAEGESVTITADEPAYDKLFKEWTGTEGLTFTSGSASASTATFIMPDHDVTVTATYDTGYTLTVRNGTGTGKYAAGAKLTITANNPPDGQRFKEWSGLTSSWIISGSKTTPTVTFTMPSFTHVVIATYEEIPPACTVTYKVVNGTWSDGTTADKTETVESGSRPAGVPAGMIASSGYTGGAWDVNPGTTTVNGDRTFTYTFEPVPTYAVTVNKGTGGGDYAEGESVTITANAPEPGMQFKEWTGAENLTFTEGSASTSTATFTMPPNAVTLTASYEDIRYAITTDNTTLAYYYNESFEQVFPTEAAEGTELSLMLDESAVPEEGNYFTGEFWYVATGTGDDPVYLGSVTENGWTSPVTAFTMPAYEVTIGAVQAARETLTLSFAPGETRALPMDAWMQLQFVEGEEGEPSLIWYDEATEMEALDLNRDGLPDLGIAFDAADCVNLARLPACSAFGEFSFPFSGPADRYGTITFTMPSVEAPAFGPAAFTLPAALKTIEESAFEGMTAVTVVDAGQVTAIGPNAFQGCTNLTQIRLPKTCEINSSAFDGCGTVYVFAPAGGTTETSCDRITNCVFVPTE